MSAPDNTEPKPQALEPRPAVRPPGGRPLPPPRVDMMASREMQEWIARLQRERRRLGVRNRYLTVLLAAAVVLLIAVVWSVYHATVGAYAVLDDVRIAHDPANQARLLFSFRVVSPGKVYYRRTSGNVATDVIDYFHAAGEVQRSWSWTYEPGKSLDVTVWFRRGLLRRVRAEQFPTSSRADIVFLIDTTGSMSRSIAELKEKCVTFSEALTKQALEHRFALIGFGDAKEGAWLDKHGFTSDVGQLRKSVDGIKRFDGGDLPESALDALEEALTIPCDPAAIRRFYLVTDAPFHDPARTGATARQIAQRLEAERVVLHVFSRREYRQEYVRLLGDSGRFQEIESFGKVLSEGCILED